MPPALGQQVEPATSAMLTLRLRDAPLCDVVYSLYQLTGQGYVVDAGVVSRASVELVDKTPAEVEQAMEALGLSFSRPGRLRRVAAAGQNPSFQLPGAGYDIPFEMRRPCDVREFLQLVLDVTGDEIYAPSGSLGRFVAFTHQVPAEDLLSAVLASARLSYRRDGSRILVSYPSDPDAVLLPADSGGRHYGHVAYREGEAPRTRPAWIEGVTGKELIFTGVVGRGTSWAAMTTLGLYRPGTRLFDGKLESVGHEGAVVLLDGGERLEWRIAPADPGIALLPEAASQTIERARAAMDARDFDESERILHGAIAAAAVASDAAELRGALADVLYARAQLSFARHAIPDAVRDFEAAYEIDRIERPWQAGEDLNEIGFAWTALGEPERAVAPHRRALELARTNDFKNEPRAFSCVRSHPRSSWIEPSALNGLGNAERARGRFAEAREHYERAIQLWQAVGDPVGRSAALTGLGLVEQGLGRPARARQLHQQALKLAGKEHAPRAAILSNLGSAQLALGRRGQARASFEAALADYRLLRDSVGMGTVLNNLAALAESRAETAKACATYAESLAASRAGDDRRGQAITLARLERLVGLARAGDAALARCREALAARRD